MSTMLLGYLLISAYAAIALIGIEAWEYRHKSDYTPMTLVHLFQGAALALVPIVNILTSIGVTVYFFGEIAPNIVLFGKKRQ